MLEINKEIIAAAEKTAQNVEISDRPVAVVGYKGIYVARAEASEIQPFHFFSIDKTRYCLGPRKKA